MTTSVSTPATIHIQHPATQQVIVAAAAPTNTTRTAVVASAAPSNNGCRTATAVVANGGGSGGGNKFFLPLLPQHPVRPNELLHKQAVTAVTAAGNGDNKVILAASGEGGRLIPVQISTSNGGARQITLAKPTTASRTIQIFKPASASAATASPKGSKLQEALVHGKKQQVSSFNLPFCLVNLQGFEAFVTFRRKLQAKGRKLDSKTSFCQLKPPNLH